MVVDGDLTLFPCLSTFSLCRTIHSHSGCGESRWSASTRSQCTTGLQLKTSRMQKQKLAGYGMKIQIMDSMGVLPDHVSSPAVCAWRRLYGHRLGESPEEETRSTNDSSLDSGRWEAAAVGSTRGHTPFWDFPSPWHWSPTRFYSRCWWTILVWRWTTSAWSYHHTFSVSGFRTFCQDWTGTLIRPLRHMPWHGFQTHPQGDGRQCGSLDACSHRHSMVWRVFWQSRHWSLAALSFPWAVVDMHGSGCALDLCGSQGGGTDPPCQNLWWNRSLSSLGHAHGSNLQKDSGAPHVLPSSPCGLQAALSLHLRHHCSFAHRPFVWGLDCGRPSGWAGLALHFAASVWWAFSLSCRSSGDLSNEERDAVWSLRDILQSRGVPDALTEERALHGLSKIGLAKIQEALGSKDQWGQLKALGSAPKVNYLWIKPAELEAQIRKRAQQKFKIHPSSRKSTRAKSSGSQPTVVDPLDLKLIDNTFVTDDDETVTQLKMIWSGGQPYRPCFWPFEWCTAVSSGHGVSVVGRPWHSHHHANPCFCTRASTSDWSTLSGHLCSDRWGNFGRGLLDSIGRSYHPSRRREQCDQAGGYSDHCAQGHGLSRWMEWPLGQVCHIACEGYHSSIPEPASLQRNQLWWWLPQISCSSWLGHWLSDRRSLEIDNGSHSVAAKWNLWRRTSFRSTSEFLKFASPNCTGCRANLDSTWNPVHQMVAPWIRQWPSSGCQVHPWRTRNTSRRPPRRRFQSQDSDKSMASGSWNEMKLKFASSWEWRSLTPRSWSSRFMRCAHYRTAHNEKALHKCWVKWVGQPSRYSQVVQMPQACAGELAQKPHHQHPLCKHQLGMWLSLSRSRSSMSRPFNGFWVPARLKRTFVGRLACVVGAKDTKRLRTRRTSSRTTTRRQPAQIPGLRQDPWQRYAPRTSQVEDDAPMHVVPKLDSIEERLRGEISTAVTQATEGRMAKMEVDLSEMRHQQTKFESWCQEAGQAQQHMQMQLGQISATVAEHTSEISDMGKEIKSGFQHLEALLVKRSRTEWQTAPGPRVHRLECRASNHWAPLAASKDFLGNLAPSSSSGSVGAFVLFPFMPQQAFWWPTIPRHQGILPLNLGRGLWMRMRFGLHPGCHISNSLGPLSSWGMSRLFLQRPILLLLTFRRLTFWQHHDPRQPSRGSQLASLPTGSGWSSTPHTFGTTSHLTDDSSWDPEQDRSLLAWPCGRCAGLAVDWGVGISGLFSPHCGWCRKFPDQVGHRYCRRCRGPGDHAGKADVAHFWHMDGSRPTAFCSEPGDSGSRLTGIGWLGGSVRSGAMSS